MNILFLQKRPLFPADMGGKIRTLNVLRYLAQWHQVTYLCNVQDGEEQGVDQMRELGLDVVTLPWRETARGTLRFCSELAANLFSPHPYNVDKDYDPALHSKATELLASGQFDLLVCDFVQMARNAIGLDVPASILFEHNVEAEIFRRHAEQDSGWLRRKYMGLQWKKMQRFEAEAGRQFDTVVAVSRRDQQIYEQEYGWNHVQVIDTAVDLDFFQPDLPVEQPSRVVFVGSMDWLPNQDGVCHFVEKIWPAVRAKCPDAQFRVVGRNPPPAVEQLAQVAGVEVMGTVPDIRPYLAEAAVAVVPLLVGGGTRLKIFEAMAMQKAVVSTPLGAEGLEVTSGQDVLLAEADADFADSLVELLHDTPKRNALAAAARQLVEENYSAESVARQFESICQATVDKSKATAQVET